MFCIVSSFLVKHHCCCGSGFLLSSSSLSTPLNTIPQSTEQVKSFVCEVCFVLDCGLFMCLTGMQLHGNICVGEVFFSFQQLFKKTNKLKAHRFRRQLVFGREDVKKKKRNPGQNTTNKQTQGTSGRM